MNKKIIICETVQINRVSLSSLVGDGLKFLSRLWRGIVELLVRHAQIGQVS